MPTAGAGVKYGAWSERLTVKICPTARQSHVPAPWLDAGSESGPGQPSAPPGWLHDIAESRPMFSACDENDCWAAATVVSVIRRAWVRPRVSALGTNWPWLAPPL